MYCLWWNVCQKMDYHIRNIIKFTCVFRNITSFGLVKSSWFSCGVLGITAVLSPAIHVSWVVLTDACVRPHACAVCVMYMFRGWRDIVIELWIKSTRNTAHFSCRRSLALCNATPLQPEIERKECVSEWVSDGEKERGKRECVYMYRRVRGGKIRSKIRCFLFCFSLVSIYFISSERKWNPKSEHQRKRRFLLVCNFSWESRGGTRR